MADNAPVTPQIFGFSWSQVEPIRSEPKSVRTSVLEFGTEGLDNAPYLLETIDFDCNKKPIKRCIYHQDGRLNFRQLCSYDSAGRLSEIQVLDESGVPNRIENASFLPDGTEVREARDRSGKIVERVTTKRDGEGRVREILFMEIAGDSQTTPIEVAVSHEDEGETRKQTVLTKHNDGSILVVETKSHDGSNETVFSYAPSDSAPLTQLTQRGIDPSAAAAERITERDQAGNWIRKEIYGPGGPDEVMTETSRVITY